MRAQISTSRTCGVPGDRGAETAARFRAREELPLADARQQMAELDARAKIGIAEVSRPRRPPRGSRRAGARAQHEVIELTSRAAAAVNTEMVLVATEAIREKAKGEAEGLTDEAAATDALD